MTRYAVVGGTGFEFPAVERLDVPVHTPFGDIDVSIAPQRGFDVVHLHRHGAGHEVPPHRINHRGNVDALARCAVTRAFGVVSVGALTDRVHVPGFGVPLDFVDFSSGATFHDSEVVHVDVSVPYCPELRRALVDAAHAVGESDLLDGGVYVTTRGPRLETKAEIRALADIGEYVGMTGGPEATLMRERGICYAQLALVVNQAAGRGGALHAKELSGAARSLVERASAILRAAFDAIPETRGCKCAGALTTARLSK